jgi:hypothetical protein
MSSSRWGIAVLLVLVSACGSGGSKPSGDPETPDNADPGGGGGGGTAAEAAPDAGPPPVASCEECLAEAGRWWHTDTNSCTAEAEECVDGGNCVDGDPYTCPGGAGLCEGGTPAGACVKTTACVDYFDVDGKALTKLEKACKKGGGTWDAAGCDRTKAIGGCSQPNKPGCLIAWYGDTFQETSPKLREQCAAPKKQWLLP